MSVFPLNRRKLIAAALATLPAAAAALGLDFDTPTRPATGAIVITSGGRVPVSEPGSARLVGAHHG
jgi:hypothetical protein